MNKDSKYQSEGQGAELMFAAENRLRRFDV